MRRPFRIPLADGRILDLGARTLVMGILNVTPDSFADGGERFDPDVAIADALRMQDEGAEILDVGGESTRPGAAPLPEVEERRRVEPVLEGSAGPRDDSDFDRHLQGVDRRARARSGRDDRQRHQRADLRPGARGRRRAPGRGARAHAQPRTVVGHVREGDLHGRRVGRHARAGRARRRCRVGRHQSRSA